MISPQGRGSQNLSKHDKAGVLFGSLLWKES